MEWEERTSTEAEMWIRDLKMMDLMISWEVKMEVLMIFLMILGTRDSITEWGSMRILMT